MYVAKKRMVKWGKTHSWSLGLKSYFVRVK